jgi:excisionase family DNA binding protein
MNLADSLEKRTTALTVAEVAKWLSVSPRQVYTLAAQNRIPNFRVGGCIRFDPSTVANWLRQKMVPAH